MVTDKALLDRIFLCGFMGAGKSTLGQALAKATGQPFYDLDDTIEQETGWSIPELFAKGGEGEFRAYERQTLSQLMSRAQGVIALGGGTLQNQEIVDRLKANGLLVFIEAPLSVILPRIMQYNNRPLLMDQTGRMKGEAILQKELQYLYQQRMPMYRQAHITLEVSAEQPSTKIAQQLLKNIQAHEA